MLDLGCGQGRDALVVARQGHSVHGIDIAGFGIAQLEKRAKAEGFHVRCETRDVEGFHAERQYDVVVLDRVLHMLPTKERRRAMLCRAQDWVIPGGHILLADIKRNRALIRAFFPGDVWQPVLSRNDYFFVRRGALPK